MGFSSALMVCVLFLCICHASASVIPEGKIVERGDSGEFKVHIMERGTKFVEKIKIDEDNDIEYFHVPAHNGLTEADYLYDFRNKMAVSRVKSDGKCYLGPLPDNLPNPADLKTGLQTVPQTPPSEDNFVVQKYWVVSDQVDKTLLRQEVQDFCGEFPVFSLREVDLNSAAGLGKRTVGRTRLARDLVRTGNNSLTQEKLQGLPFCYEKPFPIDPVTKKAACNSEDWIFNIKIRDRHCTWYLICRFDSQGRVLRCEDWDHQYNSMICYDVSCPPKTEAPTVASL